MYLRRFFPLQLQVVADRVKGYLDGEEDRPVVAVAGGGRLLVAAPVLRDHGLVSKPAVSLRCSVVELYARRSFLADKRQADLGLYHNREVRDRRIRTR